MISKIAYVVFGAALITSTACQQENKNIERKLDQILQKLDRMPAGGGAGAIGADGGRGAKGGQRRPNEPDPSKTYAVPIDNDPFDGPADAKVTVVKAYDYACPYCEKVRGTMEQLHAKYGENVRVVYKQLVVHPRNAMAGALAFCAAGKQGKHKEMNNLIWDKGYKGRQLDNSDIAPAAGSGSAAPGQGAAPTKCWDTPGGCAGVVGYATELGLNVDKFKSDMKGECMQIVQNDQRQLQGLGVSATPGFFINGRFLSGAQPIENFQALIDQELQEANKRIQQGTPKAQYYQQWVIDKGLKTVTPSAEKG
ncbi:MAG: DsbA family protein [Kofleriaceae bacterium]